MTDKIFYLQLGILALLVALILLPILQHAAIYDYQSFSWISWVFFVLFTIGLYIACSKAAQSENEHLFGQVFLLSILFKFTGSCSLIIVYALAVKPTSAYFILPFLLIYVAFLAYELYFVTKLAKK